MPARSHRLDPAEVLLVALAVGCLALALLPLGAVAARLLDAPALGSALLEVLGRRQPWVLLGETLALGLAVTAVAVLVGLPLGALLALTDVWARRLCLLVHGVPLLMPPLLLALGWFYLLAPEGSSYANAGTLFSRGGLVGVMGLALSPVVTSLTFLGLQGIDPSQEEAARLAASAPRALLRVLLPLSWPAVGLATLVLYVLFLSELGVPAFLRTPTYGALVFSRLGGLSPSPGQALALLTPLALVALLLLGLERRLLGRRAFESLGLRSRRQPPLPLGPLRAPASVLAWALALLPGVPLAMLGARAGVSGLREAWPWAEETLWTSLETAAGAATGIAAIGLVLGHRLARQGDRVSRATDGLGLLGLLAPGSLVAVGVIAAWNRPSFAWLYASEAVIVLGLVGRYAILGIRTVAVAVSRSPVSLESTAEVFGVGYGRRLVRIVVPRHAPALAGAWLLALIFCLRDLDTVVGFYPPGLDTLPVRIFTLEAGGPPQVVAGLAWLHVLVTAGVLGLGAAGIAGLGSLSARRRRAAKTPRSTP